MEVTTLSIFLLLRQLLRAHSRFLHVQDGQVSQVSLEIQVVIRGLGIKKKGKELYSSVQSFQHWSTNWGYCKLKLTINTNQVKCWFLRGGGTGAPGENLSVQSRELTNSTHITMLDMGIEPRPHWWEASALTTAPSLHLLIENSQYTILLKWSVLNYALTTGYLHIYSFVSLEGPVLFKRTCKGNLGAT